MIETCWNVAKGIVYQCFSQVLWLRGIDSRQRDFPLRTGFPHEHNAQSDFHIFIWIGFIPAIHSLFKKIIK